MRLMMILMISKTSMMMMMITNHNYIDFLDEVSLKSPAIRMMMVITMMMIS